MYQWNIQDVFQLLGIPFPSNKKEVMVDCPFCGSKRFSMNMYKGTGHCFKCNEGADSASYYAQVKGMSLKEAREDIESSLGITNDWKKEKLPPRIIYKQPEDIPIAPLEVRDRTYRAFLDELSLSEKNMNMLLARGFNKSTINSLNYKTFPSRSEIDFFKLCKRLQEDGCILKGVPGFFQTRYGDWTFVSLTKGIIMPSVTINNKIQFLQIRKDDDLRIFNEDQGQLEAKCAWFSSRGLTSGTGASTPVSFSTDMKFNSGSGKYWPITSKTYILTEGIMKADLIHDLMPNCPVISVAGVRNYKQLPEILHSLHVLGVENILHCYDMDYRNNENVADAMRVTRKMIEDEGLNYKFNAWETKINVEGKTLDLLKGLDDYLAYIKKGIIPQIKEANQK